MRIKNILDMFQNKIINLGAPTSDSDASTKKYVDDSIVGHNHDARHVRYVDLTVNTARGTAAKTTVESVTFEDGVIYNVLFQNGTSVSTPTLNGVNIRIGTTNVSTTTLSTGESPVVIPMRYNSSTGTLHIFGSHRTSDSTISYNIAWNQRLVAGQQITQRKLLKQGVDNKWYPLLVGDSTAVNAKTINDVEFRLNSPILYYNSTIIVASNGVTSATTQFSEINISTNFRYSTNQMSGWVRDEPIYLKGTVNENGNFVLAGAGTNATDCMTQDLPTTEDGFVYIMLGYCNSTDTRLWLTMHQPIYEFKDGELNQYTPSHTHDPGDINTDENNRFVTDAEKATWNAKGSSNLALGSTSSTAHRGDHGVIAYNHSQAAHAPSDAPSNATFVAHTGNTTSHITAAERTTWNGKQNALGYTPVNKAGDTIGGKISFSFMGTPGEDDTYLELQGNQANDASNENGGAFIKFRTSTSNGYGAYIGGHRRPNGQSAMVFKTGSQNPGTTMYLNEQGRLGIGTTAPSQALHVSGNIRVDQVHIGTTRKDTNWDAAYSHITNNGSDHDWIDQDVTSSSSPVFKGLTVDDGNVEIKSPTDSGVMWKMYGWYNTHSLSIGYTSVDRYYITTDHNTERGNLVLGTNGDSDQVFLDYRGNVGVGKAPSLSYKLDIDGNLSANEIHIGTTRKDTNWDTAYTHSQASHAPTNAQANQTLTSGNGMAAWTATSGNLTIALGTPSDLSASTTNGITATSHTHSISTGAASGLSSSSTNTEGSSANLARADHTHAITGFATSGHTHDFDKYDHWKLVAHGVAGTHSVGSGSTVTLKGGTNVSLSRTNGEITINATDTDTVTRLRNGTGGTYRTGDLTLIGGTNVTITENPNGTFTWSSVNTTYSAGNGLTLTSGAFALGTPSSLNGSTTNSTTTTSHTHAISLSAADVGARPDTWLPPNDHTHSNKANLDTINQNLGTGNNVQFSNLFVGGTSGTPYGSIDVMRDGVANGINIWNGSNTTFRIYREGNVGYITRGGNNNSGIQIASDGNIGIGTATPNDKLDIAGDARIRQENALKFGGTGASDSKVHIQYNANTNSLDFNFV